MELREEKIDLINMIKKAEKIIIKERL